MTSTRPPASGPARALDRWIESRSDFWRPVATGAGFILMLILARGGIVGPIILAVLLVASAHPLHDLTVGALAFVLAIVGGGLSGLGYSIAGRWVRPIPRVGPYLAGWITVAPYIAMLSLIVRALDSKPLFVRLEADDYVIMGLMIALFGTQLGYGMFRRPQPPPRQP